MKRAPILYRYVSEIDELLKKFDNTHPELSLAQQCEINKYQRIYKLRDSASHEEPKKLWDEFES